VHVIEDARGRKTDSNPVGSPNLNDGLGDFEGEAAAVGHGAAIRVGPMVGSAAEELVEEVPVRVMNFYAVEAGLFGKFCPVDVFGNDSGDFGDFEGTWGDVVHHIFPREDLSFGSDGGGGNWENAVGLKAGMGDATDVPELEKDKAS
jgi:hypothetical protein